MALQIKILEATLDIMRSLIEIGLSQGGKGGRHRSVDLIGLRIPKRFDWAWSLNIDLVVGGLFLRCCQQ